MKYTKSQLDAIRTIDKNLQIIACAGSGKTEVIAQRIASILANKAPDGLKPANVVAFTFTDRAAAELKDRVHQRCVEALGSDLGLADLFVGTIHGYCLSLLQSPPLYRYLKYRVLTDVQQRLFIDRYSDQSGLSQVPLLNRPDETLSRGRDSRLYQAVLGILAEGNVKKSMLSRKLLSAHLAYLKLCNERKYFDYSGIMAAAVKALRTEPALREAVKARVKYVTVDEYQDVNPLQEALIRELYKLGANICVVGDDDQTIYQWRGSEVRNILTFANRYSKVRTIPLNENFRSSTGVVSAARSVVELNPSRLAKAMVSVKAEPYERGDVLALEYDTPEREAAAIITAINNLHGVAYCDPGATDTRGLTYADCAVLLRSVKKDGDPIVMALKKAKIPYVVGGMNRLFETPEVQAMRCIFWYLAGYLPRNFPPVQTRNLRKILRDAKLGLSETAISETVQLLKERKASIASSRTSAELYLQRVYLDLLERANVREQTITDAYGESGRTGEVVFFNLGKFSQVISDYDQINFHSSPTSLYFRFGGFLEFQAPDYYPEGVEDAGYARPDAVQVMTVHQAKGMQWPAVFVPALRNNRFPSRRQGGRSVWHIIDEDAVADVARYRGTVEDERRLFYVALTRAERFLWCSWAPMPTNKQQRRISPFFAEFTQDDAVLTRPIRRILPQATPKPRRDEANIALTFSELKYYFICPYLFKLHFLYGFNAPIDLALGYGKSLHDALAEIHTESLKGNIPTAVDIPRLVNDHLFLPFASKQVQDNLINAANKVLAHYVISHAKELARLEHAEMPIELRLADGVIVSGRIDLIRRLDTDEIVVVDFKSTVRAQADDISLKQLHIYATGYEKLTGRRPSLIEVHDLDHGITKRESVDDALIQRTLTDISAAGKQLQNGSLKPDPGGCDSCGQCDMKGLCR